MRPSLSKYARGRLFLWKGQIGMSMNDDLTSIQDQVREGVAKALTPEALEELRVQVLPGVACDLLHGRMSAAEKDRAMERFRKIGTRRAQAISKVMAASRILVAKGRIQSAAIALGSIAPTPVRLAEVEKFLAGKSLSPALIEEAEKLAQASVRPIADIRSSAEYRRWASGRLVRDALENL